LVEESVFAVVGGPDGEVTGPGDASLGGLPEEFRVGVFGEFVEADVAAVNGHGVRIGGESDDAGAVLEFDVADFDFFGEGRGTPFGIEGFHFDEVFTVAEDGASVAHHVGEFVNVVHVFEGAWPIFGDEEVIAVFEAETFADVFEAVTESPADADRFFREGEDLLFGLVERVFGFDPGDLVSSEVAGEEGGGVDFCEGEEGAHRIVES
jgi:hypothetical protein